MVITTPHTLRAAQDKTKSFFAFPTQQFRAIEIALLIRITEVDMLAFTGTVVKWTITIVDKSFRAFIVI